MPGTNFSDGSIALGGKVDSYFSNPAGHVTYARCTVANLPTGAANYAVGCLIAATDTGAIYANTGSITSATWTLLESAIGGVATSLVDSNGLTTVSSGATASAVNNLKVTNSATGAVSVNAVLLSAVGTDSAISIQISPKGATGLLGLGLATGTGTITIGSSSAAQTVAIGDGAGISTVNIAVNGAAGNIVNVATGAFAATVTIGNVTSTTVVNINAGTGASTFAATGAGTLTLGGAAQTGDLVVGSSSGTQSVKIGNGAGVSTVNIANVSVAGANVNMATAATGAGITDTVAISTGNAAATGIKVVNILTGTPGTSGNNRLTMGGGATTLATFNAVVTSYQAINYQPTEGGANNAITCNLVDASGNNVTLAAGLEISLKIAHSLQAGANTLNLNAGGTKAIKKHTNPANDIGTAYVSGSVVKLLYDGTQWQDMAQ